MQLSRPMASDFSANGSVAVVDLSGTDLGGGWPTFPLEGPVLKDRVPYFGAMNRHYPGHGGMALIPYFKSSDAPALRKHAAEDRDAGGTGRIAARDGGFQIGCEETGAWRGVVGNGPQTVRSRLPARTKRWNWPLSWTSFSQDQGNAPTACAKGGVGLLASLSEVGKRKFRLTPLPSGEV
jgi:hypothetical protein